MADTPAGGWLPSADPILRDVLALWSSRALAAGQRLGVFAELGSGPRTAARLAGALGLAPAAARDLLDTLLALGWLLRDGDDAGAVYLATREGSHFLDPRSPGYLGDLLLAARAPWSGPDDAALDDALRAGAGARPEAWGSARTLVRERLGRLYGAVLAEEAPLPAGATLNLLLDGDGPEQRLARLRAAAQALAPGSHLRVLDHLADDARRLHAPALVFGLASRMTGQRRGAITEGELRSDCLACGLVDEDCLALPGGASVLSARKPP